MVHDQGIRSRRQIARVTGSLLAVLVLLFAGLVRAQDSPRIGMKIRSLTVELRKQHKLPEDAKGALVTAVTAGSPAQEKGIVVGDVIVEAAGKPVDTAQAVAKSIAAASESIALKVMNSKGERRDVTVPVAKKPAGGSAPILPGPK
jgi:S1-C subfamily serine protease